MKYYNYISPEIEMMDIMPEGLLASSPATLDAYESTGGAIDLEF